MAKENNIKEEVLAEWVRNNDKKFEISEEIIRLVEQSELVKKFTKLNDDFTRLRTRKKRRQTKMTSA